jgi:hypothetical protein
MRRAGLRQHHHPKQPGAAGPLLLRRVRDHRQRQKAADTPITVEVDLGSASSRGRLPERAWLVRIRRADRTVIVAIGLRRAAADRLAEDLTEILTNTTQPQGAAID